MPDEPRLQHKPLIDPHELDQLHNQCFSWALTCTRGCRGDAEEVLQMTYLAIVEGRARFGGSSSLRTWLFAVIRDHARSQWRRARLLSQTIARPASFALQEEACIDTDALANY